MTKAAPLVAALLLFGIPPASARTFVDAERRVAVDPGRGVDRRVDYAALLRYGPWDDRNYGLTLEDLALLAPDETDQRDPIPAFFRVEMRRANPSLRRGGPAQYPRHALPIFRQLYGGYLVGGKLYRELARSGGRPMVVLEDGVDAGATPEQIESLTGEARVSTPNGGSESAIKVHPTDVNRVIAGTNGPISNQTMWYSTNGGTTWTLASSLPLGGTGGDPAVDWSSTGAFAYTTTLGGCSFNGCKVWFYRSNDGGVTWNGLESVTPGSPRRDVTTGGSDKEYLHVDKFPASPFKDRIYLTWHDNNVMKFAVSSDFGNTFVKQAFSSSSSELGIGSDIVTGKNGEIYYVWAAFNSRTIRVKKSTDGGTTFAAPVVVAGTQAAFTFPIPSIEVREVFVYASADADLSAGPFGGSVYVAWTDSTGPTSSSNPALNHARIQVAASHNGGSSWTVTTPHETADALTVDRWHPWIAVGPDGTVHVVYYDTRQDPSRSSVDLYYSFSTDGAATWSAPRRVTTVTSPNISDGFEFGDYNGLDSVLASLIAIFTDNRDESGGTARSVDVYAAGIAPSGSGRVPDGGAVPGLPLLVDKSGTDLALSWSVACGPASDYEVYEGALGVAGSLTQRLCSTGGATFATITPGAGDSYYLVVPSSGGKEGSYGRKSDGSERAPALSACAPQQITGCP